MNIEPMKSVSVRDDTSYLGRLAKTQNEETEMGVRGWSSAPALLNAFILPASQIINLNKPVTNASRGSATDLYTQQRPRFHLYPSRKQVVYLNADAQPSKQTSHFSPFFLLNNAETGQIVAITFFQIVSSHFTILTIQYTHKTLPL